MRRTRQLKLGKVARVVFTAIVILMLAAVFGARVYQPMPKVGDPNRTVYITKTGKRYHADGCDGLKYSKFPIRVYEAKQRGYTPCRYCRPGL